MMFNSGSNSLENGVLFTKKNVVLGLFLSVFNFATIAQTATHYPRPTKVLANPASVNCTEKHQGRLEIKTDLKTGGQVGMCWLSPTLAVEEWCLFRRDQDPKLPECPNFSSALTPKDKTRLSEKMKGLGRVHPPVFI